jgi:hypothetical protein
MSDDTMTDTISAPIPVYISRHQETVAPYEKGYGAFIDWKVGERAIALSTRGNPPHPVTIMSGIMANNGAPEISGAHGRGRWVCEVVFDGETERCAVSTAQLTFP